MIERPSLHALAIFLAVVEHGTMTAAAEAEGISQPAISAQIKVLERYYGTPAAPAHGSRASCRRPPGRLSPTMRARILALVDELGRVVRDLEGLAAGGSSSAPAAPSASSFCRPTWDGSMPPIPTCALEVRIGNSAEITAAVRDARARLRLRRRARRSTADLIADPVFADEIVAFVAPGDPLLREAPIDAADARRAPVRAAGASAPPPATSPLRCLAAAGCEPGHVIELGSNEAVKRAVEAGLGIGLLSTHTIEAERMAGAPRRSPARGLGVPPIVLAHPAPRPRAHPGRAGIPGTGAAAGKAP